MFGYEKKNLSDQFRSTVGEIKALFGQLITTDSICSMDPDQAAIMLRTVKASNDLLELSCDMFEKQEHLMDKMNKVMDKYLESQD